MVVKRWLKITELYGASVGYLSSYSWSILVIFWLQAKGLIPPIEHEQAWEPRAETYVPAFGNMGTLLIGFFEFYSQHFDWNKHVVSLYHGVPTSHKDQFFEFTKENYGIRICDPLKPTRDLGDVLHYGSADKIKKEMDAAYLLLKLERSIKSILTQECHTCERRISDFTNGKYDEKNIFHCDDCWATWDTPKKRDHHDDW